MQQVLNSQERSQSFLKFLLFFLITVTVVIMAIYFDFRVPVAENRSLKEEVYVQRQLASSQEVFANKVKVVSAILDSMEHNPEMASRLKNQYSPGMRELGDLNAAQKGFVTPSTEINNLLLEKMTQIEKLNEQIEGLKKQLGRINELQQQLNDCKERVSNAKSDVRIVE